MNEKDKLAKAERVGISLFEKILSREIAIDFKACLYFFCIAFFYCIYRIATGSAVADILHLAEIIAATYVMGYFQMYLLGNFDEADKLGKREWGAMLLCSAIYGLLSRIWGWFDGQWLVIGGFTVFVFICYICMFLTYKVKRNIDTKVLNDDLQAFKRGTIERE